VRAVTVAPRHAHRCPRGQFSAQRIALSQPVHTQMAAITAPTFAPLAVAPRVSRRSAASAGASGCFPPRSKQAGRARTLSPGSVVCFMNASLAAVSGRGHATGAARCCAAIRLCQLPPRSPTLAGSDTGTLVLPRSPACEAHGCTVNPLCGRRPRQVRRFSSAYPRLCCAPLK